MWNFLGHIIHTHARHLPIDAEELEPVLDIQSRGRNRCIPNRAGRPAITVMHLHRSAHHVMHALRRPYLLLARA